MDVLLSFLNSLPGAAGHTFSVCRKNQLLRDLSILEEKLAPAF